MVVYSDTEDIEGFKLLDQTGYYWEVKTPSGGDESKLDLIYGPIIGFRVITRETSYADGTEVYGRVPIYMSIIYNTCACEMSDYRGDSQPSNMQSRAVKDEAQTQVLVYQKDTIGFYHG